MLWSTCRALLVGYVPVCVPVAAFSAARLWSTGSELTPAGARCDPVGICRAQRLALLGGGCRESGSVGRRLCLCQGCPFLLRAALQAQNPSQSSGGTTVLREEMPLQMETNNLKGWRILPERGTRWRGIVLKHRPSLVLPCPFLILASPNRVSAGKAPAVLQNQRFTRREVEAQLVISTHPKIIGCQRFAGLPGGAVCGSVTLCS